MTEENEIIQEAKESALKSPIIKWIVLIASILTIGGITTVKTFKNELTDLICESQKKIVELEEQQKCGNSVVVQTMYLDACKSTLICYTTAAGIMGIDDSACRAINEKETKEVLDYIEKQNQ